MTAVRETAPPEITVVLGDPRLGDRGKVSGRFAAEDLEAFARLKAALAELAEYRFRFLDDHRTLLADLAADPPAFALNFCDTGFRNEAHFELHVAALLELLGVPYSGSPPATLALAYDKALVRALAAELGVPVPAERFVRPSEALAAAIPERYPALVKPNRGDGSIGITRRALVRDEAEARAYLEELRRAVPEREILVQEYLPGTEYGVGLIGNPVAGRRPASAAGFTVLPLMEVDFGGLPEGFAPILSYESKADPSSPYYSRIAFREARVDDDRRRSLVEWSVRLFERLGCRDYARFDFRTGADGVVRLLEVNPNPAWCWDGKLAYMTGFAGRDYPDLLARILDAARRRVAAGTPPEPPA